MPVLEDVHYKKVIEIGKKAIQYLNNNEIEPFFQTVEEAWNMFPEPRENWNQAYNYTKMVFNHAVDLKNKEESHKWMNRLIGVNNALHLADDEIQFFLGVYFYETGEKEKALEKWIEVEKSAGLRYFESERGQKYFDYFMSSKT